MDQQLVGFASSRSRAYVFKISAVCGDFLLVDCAWQACGRPGVTIRRPRSVQRVPFTVRPEHVGQ